MQVITFDTHPPHAGPSYRHTADPSSVSFHRGVYLPWLLPEAAKRNPSLVKYALSWGMPG
jgi:hypothetical protein